MYKRRHAIMAFCVALAPRADGMESQALPDPTGPPIVHQSAVRRLADDTPQQFTLSAIKISADARKAIVNGCLVGAGDRIGKSVVTEIIPGVVVLDYLGQEKRLRLLPYDVRKAQRTRSTEE